MRLSHGPSWPPLLFSFRLIPKTVRGRLSQLTVALYSYKVSCLRDTIPLPSRSSEPSSVFLWSHQRLVYITMPTDRGVRLRKGRSFTTASTGHEQDRVSVTPQQQQQQQKPNESKRHFHQSFKYQFYLHQPMKKSIPLVSFNENQIKMGDNLKRRAYLFL